MAEANPWESWENWGAERPVAEYTRGDGVTFRPGDRVRLYPLPGGDVFDLALAGKAAVIATVEQDLEGRFFLGVTVEDDPGRDLGVLGRPAHRFYFRPEEVMPLTADQRAEGGA